MGPFKAQLLRVDLIIQGFQPPQGDFLPTPLHEDQFIRNAPEIDLTLIEFAYTGKFSSHLTPFSLTGRQTATAGPLPVSSLKRIFYARHEETKFNPVYMRVNWILVCLSGRGWVDGMGRSVKSLDTPKGPFRVGLKASQGA